MVGSQGKYELDLHMPQSKVPHSWLPYPPHSQPQGLAELTTL